MSQIYKSAAGSPVVATSYETDNGTAVPAANTLIIHGIDSVENNDNGITVKGGVVGTGVANEVDVVLTNRQTATVSTADNSVTTILTFALGATPGVFFIEGNVVAFDITDSAGASYSFVTGARTTGAAGTEIATQFEDIFEEAAMATADINVLVSANNLLVTVQGITAKSIDWNCYLTYRFVS